MFCFFRNKALKTNYFMHVIPLIGYFYLWGNNEAFFPSTMGKHQWLPYPEMRERERGCVLGVEFGLLSTGSNCLAHAV